MCVGCHPAAGKYLRVSLQLAHVVLLQPAARVGRVPVRRPVQVGTNILTSPRPQQLLAPRVVPHEASEVVEAGPAADPAGAGRQAPLDLGGREGDGGGRSRGHGGRPELAAGSPDFCSAAAQLSSNIPGAPAALTGRPPPHLLICMPRSHWTLGRTLPGPGGSLFLIGRGEARATEAGRATRCGPPARWPQAGRGRARQVCPVARGELRGRADAGGAILPVAGGCMDGHPRWTDRYWNNLLLPVWEKLAAFDSQAPGGGEESGRQCED